MVRVPIAEGRIPFRVPGRILDVICRTYYKVFGDLSSGAPPVVFLHGGPGGGYEYHLLLFANLWSHYGLPVVFYDEIGCGASTHMRQMVGDKDFWQEPLFITDLDNLINHLKLRAGPGFHLFGHGWGAILGVAFAARQPRGLQRLVLASGLATMELSEKSIQLCRSELREAFQVAFKLIVQQANYQNQLYSLAMEIFRKTFVCRADPMPEELVLYGPPDLKLHGSLSGWTSIPRLPEIIAPTLMYNGEFDTSRDISQEPFFELCRTLAGSPFQMAVTCVISMGVGLKNGF